MSSATRPATASGAAGPVLGVDGCPGGWVGALVAPSGSVTWHRWSLDDTSLLLRAAEVVAIDMPIGLPESGRRLCDQQARARLAGARSSVFPVPTRAVLAVNEYRAACALAHERGEPAPSKQLWNLRPRIRRLDDLLQPEDQRSVVECHPEVAFLELARGVRGPGERPASKRSAAGVGHRLALLQAAGWPRVDASTLAVAPSEARIDDALDALVCAWTARRWQAGVAIELGDDERDARGLRMQIVA